jgi:hypothetical protein
MKKLTLSLIIFAALSGITYAGPAPVDNKNVVAPVTEWYGDNEWNVNLWGTYAFTGTDFAPNLDIFDLLQSTLEGQTVYGTQDKYLGNDHAWGGGGDIKYFFGRYFGVGIQGFALDAKRSGFNIDIAPDQEVFIGEKTTDRRVVGSVMGTFTLRYPAPGSRFAPYVWAGVGAIFGGGQSDRLFATVTAGDGELIEARTEHTGSTTELIGQFGGGLEFRFTRHIGWTNDFSWNVVNGASNDFGMFRTGVNFAF